MSDKFRWRYGETKPVVTKAVATNTVIEIGDLVEQAADGTVTPASARTWDSSLAETQADFHRKFLGVAMQRSQVGDVSPIRVATSGTFEFDCAAAQFVIGGLLGPAKASGNALENQKVVAVALPSLAIGRAVQHHSSNTTSVYVEISSTILDGGEQEPETSGS